MNPELPSVTKSTNLLGLTTSVLCLAVFDGAFSSANLPVRPELDAVGWVDVDHLHLALEPLLLGKAGHDMERVPQDHAVRPLLIMLVKLDLAVEIHGVEVVEEARQKAARFGLGPLPRLNGFDDDSGLDDFLNVDRHDVNFERFPVLLVLALPDE